MKRVFATVKVNAITGMLCLLALTMLAAPASAFRFTITSDPRGGTDAVGTPKGLFFDRTLQAINSKVGGPGAFHVSLGDMDYSATNPSSRGLLASNFGTNFLCYLLPGNHDRETTADMQWLRDEYTSGHDGRAPLKNSTKQNGPPGSAETTYSFDYGNAHFVVLNIYWNGGTVAGSDYGTDGDIVPALLTWLTNDLNANKKPFIFIFIHEPAFPYNHHYGESLDKYPANRDAFWALLESKKVSAVFAGHCHYFFKHRGDYRGHTYNYPTHDSWRTQDPNVDGHNGSVMQICDGHAGWEPGGIEAGPTTAEYIPASLQWNGLTFIDVNVTPDFAYINTYRDIRNINTEPNAGLNFQLFDTTEINGDFLAYNDCVYDSGLRAAGVDPCGNSVHYGDPNKITVYGIGTEAPEAVNGYADSNGLLKDFNTGANTNVRLTLTQSGGVNWQPQVASTWTGGYDTAPNTDAYNTFHGKADMTGTIYYGTAGWYVDANFTGLDPNKTYTFATSASRAYDRTTGSTGYPTRLSRYTISSITSANNASTTGVEVNSPYSVKFCTGNNHYQGYVARWTGINPGADGSFKVRAEATSAGNQGYAFDVIMLREEPSAPDNTPPTPDPMTWVTVPTATGPTTITMTATTATDTNNPPVQYYFECTTDGSKSSTWQTGATTYVASGLNPSTLYTFRVKARDIAPVPNETGWSTEQSATTQSLPPPGAATTPSPANAATGVAITTDLGWTAGSGATSHDVYFGTTSPGTFQGNRTTATFDTGTMDSNTTYYWRIDEKNAGGTTTGTVWSFKTAVKIPTFVTAGTAASGTGAITVPWPTHVAGDVGLLFVESTGGQVATLSTPAGFVNVTNSPQYTGATTAGTRLTAYWCRATSSAMTSPIVGDPGDHAYGIILTFRGVVGTGDPWDVTLGGIKATASTTTTFLTATTTVNNDLVVLAASRDNDLATAAWSAWTNGALSNLTERSDAGTTSGNGGGIGVATGGKVAAGAIGSTTATVTSTVDGHLTIALKPAALPSAATNPTPTNGATSVSLTQDLSWSAGAGATSHNVYFGTVASPPLVSSAQTGTTYDTGTMISGTTYYCRIDENNSEGTTTGMVWSFTTVPPAPSVATNPTPTNGATGVSLTQDLSWSAGSGATSHDVYFGTAVSPPLVSNDQTGTTYDTGTMVAGTTYYWRIDEVGLGGTTTGTAWSFTTAGGSPPAQATDPSPANSAINVGVTTDLGWSAGSGATSHDVYFGTAASPPLVSSAQLGTTFDTGTMSYNKTYYWRIDEKNSGGTTTGILWSFATKASVPNVVGSAQADANTAIIGAGLTVGSITKQYSNTVAAGIVISQNPASGTEVNTGSSVDLAISLGKPVVPNVVGMTQAAATTAITAVDNLTVGTVTTAYSDTVAAGLVISQTPVGGTEVNIGSSVDLVISLGKPVVPNVVGMTQAAATTAITAVDNLTVGTVTTAYSDTVAAGLVISQTPVGGTEVNIGSSVDLVISLGKPVVPNVVGMTQAAATTAITAVDNLTVGTVTTAYSDTVAAGLVISQTPVGGTEVNIGSSVDLTVSLGKPVVPNVVGMTQAAATTAITAVDNLTVGTVTTAYSDTVAAGLVISQTPVGGTEVNIGSSVDLAISLGKPVVPNVVGMTQAAATTAITAVDNLTVGTVTTAYSDTVAAGLVISQTPVGGTEVNIGSSVDLTVSLGKPVVPNVVGMTQAAATTAITAVDNLTVGTVTTAYSDTVAAGLVISQTPVGGTEVNIGSSVDLVISLGKPVVPNVVGMTQAAATTAITAVDNLTVGTVTTAYSNTVAAGLVISQTPVGGTEVNIGSSVDLTVSLGKPVVPNVVGMTQAAATTAITAVDNLTVGTVTTAYSDTVAAGLVISQTPVGGTEVNIGSSVDLAISLGKPVVPNVVGMTQAAATTAITAVDNLTVGTVTTAYSDTVAAGLVISQTPVGGTEVNIGSSVDLTVSLGKPVVPNVVGMTQAAATTAITAVDNLTVGTVTTAYSNTVAAGLVISQTPVGGTEVNIGSSVDLVISLGKPVVPNVVGMTQAAATTAITAVDNLTVGTVTTAYSDTVAAGLVISQTPVGGTEVNIGSSVDLVISLGKPVVPNVVGMTQAAATTAITAVDNLTVGTVTTAYSDTVAAGLVISQTPVGGTEVNIGSSVDLVVSLGKPVVPNVVGMTQAAATTAITAVDNLTVGTVTTAYSDTVAAGLVISQTPVGGTEVNIGSSVDLVISLGKPVVPNVVGMTQAAATTAITAVDNLTVGTVTTAYSDTVAAGLVISQTPVGGTEVNIGSSVDLVISLGKPVVPNVVGMTQAAATTAITAVDNLTVGTVTTAYSDTVAAGLVISQTPVGGTEVNIGSSVDLVISLGKPVVPNVVGMTQAAATTAITAVDNLTVGTVTTAYSDTVAAGLVISQTPVGGTEVNIGSSVDLVISLGKPVVPNVVGMTQAAATTAITAVDNLTVGTVTTAYSNTVAAGLVISQTPVGGTEVNIGSSVDLVVSLGKPVVPNVVGMTQADANAAILGVDNLQVGTITKQYSSTVTAGIVISQNPASGTQVNTGSSVDFVVSLGMSGGVPNVIGMAKADANTAIIGAGLTVGPITTQYSNTVAAGIVLSQNPVGGTPIMNLAPNCVGLWKLNDNAANTTVVDDSGTGHTGTASRNTSLMTTAGKINGALAFNGTDYVDVGNVLGTGAYTKVAWVKLDSGNYYNNIISSGDNITHALWAPYTDSFRLAAGHVSPYNQVRDPNPLATGQWYLVAVTFNPAVNSGRMVLYKNGAQVAGANNVPTQGASTKTCIGRLSTGSTYSLKGSVDDAMIFNRALTANEISALYNNGNGTEVINVSSVDFVVSLGKPVVPNVVGMTQAAATTAITAVDNLTVGTVTTAYSDTVAAGLVISQTPVGGTEVNIGSSVDLVISLGKPVVPNVVGMTQAAATTAITAVDNLTVGTVTTAYSDTVAAGLVISQTPVGGTEVNIGSSVDLVISLGMSGGVPNVVGMAQADANTAIIGAGLTVGSITTQYSNTVAAGIVLSQDPVGGTPIMNLAPNCVGLWKLNDNAANTTVVDDSGTGHTGTASRNTSLMTTAGKINGALAFNGTDYVDVGNVLGTGAYTKVAWVKLDGGSYYNNIISSGDNLTHALWAPYSDSFRLAAGHVSPYNQVRDINPLATGQWYLVAVTFDPAVSSGRMVLYKNGAQVAGANNVPTQGASTKTCIGRLSTASTYSLKGSVDDAMIFNRALTANEISALYNSGNGTEVLPNVSSVALVISLGKPTVPPIVGLSQADANAAILAVDNLQVGTITKEYSNTVAAGIVISQNPASGTEVNTGSSVDFVVSLGKPVVPNVVGMTQADANTAILAVDNLQVGAITKEYSSTVAAGIVISQNPASGTEVNTGSSVDLVISLGVQSQQQSLTEDFNDNKRGAMWRISGYDPAKIGVSEYAERLNLNAVAQMNLTPNCVGLWKLNDNAANTTVVDDSGTGHTGTASRNTSLMTTAGKINGALAFNGTDYVDVGNVLGTGAYTKVAWVKLDGGSYYNNIISSGDNLTHALWAPYSDSFRLAAGHVSPYNQVRDPNPLATGQWYLVAVTFDPAVSSGRMVLYKNGAQVAGANNVPTQGASTKTCIGRLSTASTYSLKGSVDDAMIFNRALTANEISALYNSGNGTETLPAGVSRNSEFSANGWGIDSNENFQTKIDFHYNAVSSPAWVGITIEKDPENYVSIQASADGSSSYFRYKQVVDGEVVSSDETSRTSNDGALYVSYDAALDELYLSYNGYGISNEWQTITDLLQGQWLSSPLNVAVGGGSDGGGISNGQAYLDNFAISGSLFGWSPATDLNSDGFVDLVDLLIMSEYWLQSGPSIPADVDKNNIVDFYDFAEFSLAW